MTRVCHKIREQQSELDRGTDERTSTEQRESGIYHYQDGIGND